MELTEALRIARAALLDTPGIVLNRRTGQAHPLPGASDTLHERADAHNVLGRHAAAIQGCGK
ncbi:hypothetical protein [Cupriavidus necator]